MSDIDFDELDKAVNSLILKTPDDASASSSQTNSPVPTTAPSTEPVQASSVSAAALTQSLAGQRSSGRFMDVIHPSSDMRQVSNQQPAVPTVAVASTVSTPPQPVSMPVASTTPTPNIESPIENNPISASVPKPLESPFISGAKVEKRPLGTFSTEPAEPKVELSPSGEVTDNTEVDESVEATLSAEGSALPEELQGDILKIESGNVSQTVDGPPRTEAPAFEKQPTAQASIVQQYKEQPSLPETKSNPIYDTNVYHKAPNPDGKKKSGWLWILWIVLLLAVGVGAGAITYFYVLPLISQS